MKLWRDWLLLNTMPEFKGDRMIGHRNIGIGTTQDNNIKKN